MKLKMLILLGTFSLYMMGCAAYKELKPEPKVSSIEDGYIEIKDKDENFELKKDKKYFMKFPAPTGKNFYLVMNVENNDLLDTYLTPFFDDGKGDIVKIADESQDPMGTSYYAVDNSVQNFYWVIESVKYDIFLNMNYRYVPQWRYKFETKYAQFQEVLVNNSVDRTAYEGIGINYNIENFSYTGEIQAVKDRTSNLQQVEKEIKDIESIFPPDIINTTDEAYQNYRNIKTQIEDELKFQKDYLAVLDVLGKERSTRKNTAAFAEAVPEYLSFFEQQDRFPLNVKEEVKRVILGRMPEIIPYYEKNLAAKRDISSIDIKTKDIEKIYSLNNEQVPAKMSELFSFTDSFNKQAGSISAIESELDAIDQSVRSNGQMPSNTYFSNIIAKTSKLKYNLPKAGTSSFGQYRNYACAQMLGSEIGSLTSKINRNLENYRAADRLVPQINAYRDQKQYGSMIRLLNQNSNLDFLADMYSEADQLSLDQQATSIRTAMYNANWQGAEANLKTLHLDTNFLKPTLIGTKKSNLVHTLEDTLTGRISRISKERARSFVEENINTLTNVEALYSNPAFTPVYEMTFSAAGQTELERKKLLLNNDLNYLKEQYFPATAVKKLYSEFVKNPEADGVLKARAIVAHGNQYKGDDKQIKTWTAECDPWASKWITQAKDYRKVFALPINASQGASNEYVVRLNIRIPSDAKFPVYDINIKLPKEIAQDAASEQWYKSITMNKDPIKNEGRYTITAPMASNDYECQVTPVRMQKDQDNILEIHFNNAKYKPFQISVMAQKPIIKKN
jgi:hypothetical protein